MVDGIQKDFGGVARAVGKLPIPAPNQPKQNTVIVTIELPADKAIRLKELVDAGQFKEHGVISAKLEFVDEETKQ